MRTSRLTRLLSEFPEKRKGFCVVCAMPLPSKRLVYCSGGGVLYGRRWHWKRMKLRQEHMSRDSGWGCNEEWALRTMGGFARACVFERDRGMCAVCKTPVAKWDVDHLVEIADGGSGALHNLRTLCKPCHKKKTSAARAKRARVR